MDKTVCEKIDRQIAEFRSKITGRQFDNVFFIGCGGALAYMEPSKYVMDIESRKTESYIRTAGELMCMNPTRLGKRSIAVVSSYGGDMLEAVEALRFAKKKGAFVVGTTYNPDSVMATESDAAVVFDFKDDYSHHPYTSQYSAMFLLTFTILDVLENNRKIDILPESLYSLEKTYKKALALHEEKANEFAERFREKDLPVVYTMASGINFSNAYIYATCILLEMQWINASAINAGEFFHGALEIVDKDSNFIMLLGLDETRKLEERALVFLNRFTDRTLVIDAKEFDMDGVDDGLKGYMAAVVINRVLRLYSTKLAGVRNHLLSLRRYYGILEY